MLERSISWLCPAHEPAARVCALARDLADDLSAHLHQWTLNQLSQLSHSGQRLTKLLEKRIHICNLHFLTTYSFLPLAA